jgi:hypothetical protein
MRVEDTMDGTTTPECARRCERRCRKKEVEVVVRSEGCDEPVTGPVDIAQDVEIPPEVDVSGDNRDE